MTKSTENDKTTADVFSDVALEYTVNYILRHVGEGDNIRYIVHWFHCTPVDDTAKPPEHIPEHFVPRNWLPVKKSEDVQQRCGPTLTKGKQKFPKVANVDLRR